MTRRALSWRLLAGLGLLAFGLRGGYLALGGCRAGAALTPDAVGYARLARNLVQHGAFSDADKEPFAADTIRTPGYPLFLGLFCGSKGCPDLCAAAIGQAMAGAVAVLLCAACALVLFGRAEVALLAGLLLAVDLVSIFHGALALSDVPFQCAFWLAFFALCCALRLGLSRAPVKLWLAAGLLLGAAALVRPIGLYFAPFAGAALLFEAKPESRAWAWRAGLAVLLGSCVLPLLWAARNFEAAGAWTVTSLPARDMAIQRASAVEGRLSHVSFAEAEAKIETELLAAHGGPFASVEEKAAFAGRWGTRFVLSHPVAAAEVAASDLVHVLFGHGLEIPCWQVWGDPACDPMHPAPSSGGPGSGTRGLLSRHRVLIPVFAGYELYLFVLYGLAVFGALRAWRFGERAETALVVSPIVYFLLASAGALAYHRFRLPFFPAVCLLAARGAAELYW